MARSTVVGHGICEFKSSESNNSGNNWAKRRGPRAVIFSDHVQVNRMATRKTMRIPPFIIMVVRSIPGGSNRQIQPVIPSVMTNTKPPISSSQG